MDKSSPAAQHPPPSPSKHVAPPPNQGEADPNDPPLKEFANSAFPPAVLSSCPHSAWQLSAGVLPINHTLALCARCAPSSSPPWWDRHGSHTAVRCPHGFASQGSPHPPPPAACSRKECLAAAAATITAARSASPEWPAKEDPIRWVGEYDSRPAGTLLPLKAIIASPFDAVSLHEHTGAFRNEWAKAGFRAASVANRPSTTPPPYGCIHFIGEVVEWRQGYPWSIPMATANPDCHTATVAARNSAVDRWRRHMTSRELEAAVVHFAWLLGAADSIAIEQPPTFLEYVFGPPTVRTSLADFGVPLRKKWHWWLRRVQPAPPTSPLDGPQPSNHHEFDDLPPDLRSIARATTPPQFAAAHVAAWAPALRATLESKPPSERAPGPRPERTPEEAKRREDALSSLTLAAAALLAPTLPAQLPARCVILIPASRLRGVPVLLLPRRGFFGVAVKPTSDLDKAAASAAALLACSSEPMLAHTHASGDERHFVFVAPADHLPVSAALASEPPKSSHPAWLTEAQLGASEQRLYASLALRRLRHIFSPVERDAAVVGVSGPSRPLVPNADARRWARAEPTDAAAAEWSAFLERDALEAAAFKKELAACDRGDGRMLEWSATVSSVAAIAHDVTPPPQGLPQMPAEAMWAPFPDLLSVPKPLPLTSQMLARLPPQSVPPGPIPTHATEALAGWFVRALFKTADAIVAREAYFFEHPISPGATEEQMKAWLKAAPPPPPDLLGGERAFRKIPHADGIGHWRANCIIFDVAANGALTVLDTTKAPFTPWLLDKLREVFDPADDKELLSHVFEGLRYKASRPRQMRVAANMVSLATHVRPIADDIAKLRRAGMYKLRPLRWLTGPLAHRHGAAAAHKKPPRIWPLRTLPAWTSPVGAVDKKDKVFEKRRISNGSWPYGLPQTREGPHGGPTGPTCRSFNELAGPMQPREGTSPPKTPFKVTQWGAPCDFCGAAVADSTRGAHTWWGRLFCWRCWRRGDHVKDEPFKWHRERKHSPATVYQALATLVAIARQVHQWVFVIITDFRWWFWQFGTHPDEYWTSQFHAVAKVGGEYAVCLVGELVANMGRSPVSNVASAVGSRLFTPVRARADAREPELALEDPPELRRICEERERRLGKEHSRLYWSGCFTDDSATPCLGRKRAALIARDVIECNEEVGVLMADLPKNPVGTWGDHIGARLLANAGIGTLTPTKRTRALRACREISAGVLSPKQFESATGLLGHVIDILALERPLMNGLGSQHRFAVAHHHRKVAIANDCRANVQQLEWAISTTGAASFASALTEAAAPKLNAPAPPVIMSSDACTGSHDPVTLELVDERGAEDPAVFGHALGYCYRFPLEGPWRSVHITVTEALGPALGALLLAPLLPYAKFLLQMDATAAVAFVLGKSKSRKLQRIYNMWRNMPGVAAFIEEAAVQHVSGKANTIDDAGSRGHWDILQAYAAACGVRLTFVETTADVDTFLSWVLGVALEDDDRPAEGPAGAKRARHALHPAAPHHSGAAKVESDPEVGASSSSPREDEAIRHMSTISPRRCARSPPRASSRHLQATPGERHTPQQARPQGVPRLISPARPSPGRGAATAPPPQAAPRGSPPRAVSAPRRIQYPSPPSRTPRLLSPPAPSQPAVILPALQPANSPKPGEGEDRERLRPRTAAAVRALASARAANKLLGDASVYALCPNDPAMLRSIVSKVDVRNAAAREASTQQKDSWGWNWWVKACEVLDTPYLRPTEELDELRESYVASFALMYTAAHMRPRSKADTEAKPQSAWDAYSHARIVLHEYGCLLPRQASVRRTLKGTLREYIRNTFDDEVLVPRRKQPFSRAHELALLRALELRMIPGWSEGSHEMMEWMLAFARCVGARKAELCAGGKWFSRASLTWYYKGRKLRPTPENIAKADRLEIRPVASKSDPFNMNWGGCLMTFDLVEGEHMSIALALRALELKYPVDPEQRAQCPLFFDVDAATPRRDLNPAPVAAAWLTGRFAALMRVAIGPEQAAARSWHSWRVTLACSLRAAVDSDHPEGRSLDIIKLFGRWRSDAAVKIYARLTPDAYARHISAALKADAAHLTEAAALEAMDNVDPMAFIREMDAIADADEGAPSEVPKKPPAKRKTPLPPDHATPAPPGAPATKQGRKRGAPGDATSVLVPRAVYPTEPCDENGGAGWSATAVPHGRGTSKVSFTNARDEGGAPFGVVYLRSACLLPLTEGAGGPAPTEEQGGGTGGGTSRRQAARARHGTPIPAPPPPRLKPRGRSSNGDDEPPTARSAKRGLGAKGSTPTPRPQRKAGGARRQPRSP